MHIIADANIAMLQATFGLHGQLDTIAGRAIRTEDLREAEVLLVRSVTPVGAALLTGTPVKFVGTATIGTDRLDTAWLDDNGIRWASAPGCNADAAAQYTLGMMALACQKLRRKLLGQKIGIIGHGNVGSRLRRLLDALEIESIACDPPLSAAGVTGLVDLDSALDQDIVSLHVPLTRSGPFPSYQMLDARRLGAMRDGALLVNTARGGVVDGAALLQELRAGRLHAALDVWPHEPFTDLHLLNAALVATPHVAGYSLEGKRQGPWMIYRAFHDWLGLASPQNPPPAEPGVQLDVSPHDQPFAPVLEAVCQTGRDDRQLRSAMQSGDAAAAFDRLRAHYPLRRDFSAWALTGLAPGQRERFRRLGFRIAGNLPTQRTHC